MNHLQVLRAFDQQSKKAEEEIKNIINKNMSQLNQDLKHQTRSELREFRKSLKLILLVAQNGMSQAIRTQRLLLWLPFAMTCVLLLGTGGWIKFEVNKANLSMYPIRTHQGKQYAVVPPTKVLKDGDGNYWVKIR